jgi:hypothetical protein
MKTTLTLDPEAFQAAKSKAERENVSFEKAVSELILQGVQHTSAKSSAVFRSEGGVYTSKQVAAILDDE